MVKDSFWNSVEDGNPTEEGTYLVFYAKTGNWAASKFRYVGIRPDYPTGWTWDHKAVTHWRDVPTP